MNQTISMADEAELRAGFQKIKRERGHLALIQCIAEIVTTGRIGMEVLCEKV